MPKRLLPWIAGCAVLLLAVTAIVLAPRILARVATYFPAHVRAFQPAPTLLATLAVREAASAIVDDNNSLVATPLHSNGALVLYVHGAGQSYRAAIGGIESTLSAALLDAGFTVTAAVAEGNAWGSSRSVETYSDLITDTLATYDLNRVYVIGESMGGLASAQLASLRDDVRAWVGVSPVCDISTIRDVVLVPQIDAVYPGGYPAELSPVDWSAKPVMVWASPSDTIVRSDTNSFACGSVDNAVIHKTEGEHGDASNFEPSSVVSFFQSH